MRSIFREIGAPRYTARPAHARRQPTSFGSLLAKLAASSGQLKKARRQARGK